MGKLLRRLGYLFRQPRFELELDEELAFHHEMKRQEVDLKGIRASGAARRELGNLALARDESRDGGSRRGFRALRRTSGSHFGCSSETAASRSLRYWCWQSASV